MFNYEMRKEAIERLEKKIEGYNKSVKNVQRLSENLFDLRNSIGSVIIKPIENYLYSLSNRPKEFDKSYSRIKIAFEKFEKYAQQIKQEIMENDIKAGVGAAAGTAAGVGVTAFMPTTAIAIATTFGTASTGAAISSLSGAAATNAALAWLGGGAVAAGGGGMAAGNVLLALAGPIGWGIAVTSLIGSGLFYSSKNKETAEKADQKSLEVYKKTTMMNQSARQIENLYHITREHKDKISEQLRYLKNNAPNDYTYFNENFKNILGALINNTNSLSRLLNQSITDYNDVRKPLDSAKINENKPVKKKEIVTDPVLENIFNEIKKIKKLFNS